MTPQEKTGWLNAALDDELGPEQSLEVEAELARDPALRAAWEQQRALRGAIREGATYFEAPGPLAARLRARAGATDAAVAPASSSATPGMAQRLHAWWRGWATTAALAACACVLGSVVTWRVLDARHAEDAAFERITADAVAGHVRAAISDHAIDVASSDQHTVKPWLTAHLTYATPVPDLSARGFELVGARRDVLEGEPVAVLVYKRRQHLISAYVRPATGDALVDRRATLRGFNVVLATRGALSYRVVSDLNPGELADFTGYLMAAE